MTLSSSLNAGVAGLNANANRLSSIADNIANASTFGYRRAVVDFHSIVSNGNSYSSYSSGGVRITSNRLIEQGGALVNTANSTDVSVAGQGFIAVTDITGIASANGNYPISLATTGSFYPDSEGILVTSTGSVLMGWPANPDGTLPDNPRDTTNALVPVRITTNQFVSNPTSEMTLAVNLPATSTRAGASGEPFTLGSEYFGNVATSESLEFTFTPTVPTAGASNRWTLRINDTASAGAVVGEYTLNFNGSQTGGGTLTSVVPISGGPYDPATGKIALTVGGGSINLSVGAPGEATGMSQLASTFAPISLAKNGSPAASLQSVSFDANGDLNAVYDQGFTRRIYKVPVIDVPNPNAVVSLNNQNYQLTEAAGPIYLWDPGTGPAGTLAGFARQESATDVAAELTQLIQTQRAYSSNAKIIQTVSEMLQETTNIIR